MTRLRKTVTIGLAAMMLTASLPQVAAADHRRHGGYHGHKHYKHHRHHRHHRPHRHHHAGAHIWPWVAVLGLTYLATRPAYSAPPARTVERVYVERAPAVPPPPAGPAASCLMTREYLTDIRVGGRTVPAYGQACLQPDGSWYYGPAVPTQ